MAKYREMSQIKSQIHLDMMYQRLFHTHQRAKLADDQKRLKAV